MLGEMDHDARFFMHQDIRFCAMNIEGSSANSSFLDSPVISDKRFVDGKQHHVGNALAISCRWPANCIWFQQRLKRHDLPRRHFHCPRT